MGRFQAEHGYFVETEKLPPGVMIEFLQSVEGVKEVSVAPDLSGDKKNRTTDAFNVIVKDEADIKAVGDKIFIHDQVISGLKL